MAQKIQMRGIVIGILFLFISACLIPFISIVQADISWDVTVNFSEPGGGSDSIVFGEASDANDGPPYDTYDLVKPPPSMNPYIRAWYNDNIPEPYNLLMKDYREYPGSSKVWNLSIQWVPSDYVSPTIVTLTWSPTAINSTEYDSITLSTNGGTPLRNMLLYSTYSFNCQANTPQNFKIICLVNQPPNTPSAPSPTNAATGVSVTTNLGWTGGDLDGDTVMYDVYFGTSSSPPKVSGNQSGTTYDLGTLNYNTLYYWRISSWDEHDAKTSGPVWSFTTTIMMSNYPPVFGTPSPTNGSTGGSLSLTWTIPINDPENDSFNWTIQCSNGQATNANTAFNGTKSLSLSGLAYVTTYKIWVNATDPTGSANYTRKWYTFTTRSSSGGGGGGGGDDEPPNIKPIADVSAREPYQGYVNTEITFDGSKSNDSDGTITKWFWVFGDNTNGTGNTVRHTYSKTGTYTVTLTVTDNEGATNTDTTTCVIIQYNGSNNSPTTPVINGTRIGTKNKTYTYSIYSTDQNNDSLQYITTWGDGTQNTSNFLQNGTIFSVSHTWVAPGKYMITAIATDNMSISDQATYSVFIDVFFVRELGFLFDSNNDGLNDSFYTNSTGLITPAQKLANESYLIDTDSDGISNYVYNPSLNALTELKKIEITAEFPWVYVALLLVVVVIVSCVAVFYLYQYGYI